jgi:hypothetical protein
VTHKVSRGSKHEVRVPVSSGDEVGYEFWTNRNDIGFELRFKGPDGKEVVVVALARVEVNASEHEVFFLQRQVVLTVASVWGSGSSCNWRIHLCLGQFVFAADGQDCALRDSDGSLYSALSHYCRVMRLPRSSTRATRS